MLITWNELKEFTGADVPDKTRMEFIAAAIEDIIASELGVTFGIKEYEDWELGNGKSLFYLKHWPATEITEAGTYSPIEELETDLISEGLIELDSDDSLIRWIDRYSVFMTNLYYYFKYKAGYTSATLPSGIKLLICEATSDIFAKSGDPGIAGLKAYTIGNIRKEFFGLMEMNEKLRSILSRYKRKVFIF